MLHRYGKASLCIAVLMFLAVGDSVRTGWDGRAHNVAQYHYVQLRRT